MVHLRIVAPDEKGRRALELLEGSGSVCNVIVFPDAARKPRGDVLMCDVAREDASAIIEEWGIHFAPLVSGGAWSGGFWRFDGLVGLGRGRHGLFEQAVEQQAAVAGVAAVEAEGELVEVVVDWAWLIAP